MTSARATGIGSERNLVVRKRKREQQKEGKAGEQRKRTWVLTLEEKLVAHRVAHLVQFLEHRQPHLAALLGFRQHATGAHDVQGSACPGQRHRHAIGDLDKTHVAFLVVAHQGEDDHLVWRIDQQEQLQMEECVLFCEEGREECRPTEFSSP